MDASTQYDNQTPAQDPSINPPPFLPQLQSFNHSLPIKLDHTNYLLWRQQMENVIFTNAFEGYIEGTVVCRAKEVSPGILNSEFVQWRRLDRLILSWIYSTLTPKVMAQIVGYQTSHFAWVALEKLFSSSTRAHLMQLQLEFQTTKKNSLSMMDYFLKLKTLSDNLAAAGDPVMRDTISCKFLVG